MSSPEVRTPLKDKAWAILTRKPICVKDPITGRLMSSEFANKMRRLKTADRQDLREYDQEQPDFRSVVINENGQEVLVPKREVIISSRPEKPVKKVDQSQDHPEKIESSPVQYTLECRRPSNWIEHDIEIQTDVLEYAQNEKEELKRDIIANTITGAIPPGLVAISAAGTTLSSSPYIDGIAICIGIVGAVFASTLPDMIKEEIRLLRIYHNRQDLFNKASDNIVKLKEELAAIQQN